MPGKPKIRDATIRRLRDTYEQQLTDGMEGGWEMVARAYYAATQSDKTVSKKAMIRAVVDSVPWDKVGAHQEYCASLSMREQAALKDYTGTGFATMNHFLRTGQGRVDISGLGLLTNISEEGGIVSASDVKKIDRDPTHAKKVCRRIVDGFTKTLEDMVHRSVGSTMSTIESIPVFAQVCSRAPGLDSDTVLWRGERICLDHFAPASDSLEEKTREHARTMLALKKGDTFSRQDFTSFSMSVQTSVKFMSTRRCCLYRLTLRADQSALVLDLRGGYSEFEVIVAPNTEFKVTRIKHIRSPQSDVSMTCICLEIV